MGNFESLRVDLGVEDNIREGEKTSDAMQRVYKFVQDRLIEKVAEVEQEIKKVRE